MMNALSTSRILGALILELIRFRPDIANVPLSQNRTGFLKWMAISLCCKAAGCKIVSRLGGGSFDRFYAASPPMMQRFIRVGLNLIDALVVRGDSLKHQFSGLVDPSKLTVVPNGLDIQGWTKGLGSRTPSPKTRVLYLGQVSKAKGVLDLLSAVEELRTHPNAGAFEFVIAGPIIESELNILHIDNPRSTSAAIQEQLERCKSLGASIRMPGAVSWEEKRELFVWADVVVCPSYSEGFPYTVLEAFASGCAVISTPVGSLPDFLEHERELYFVPVGSPQHILEAMLQLQKEAVRESLNTASAQYLRVTHDLDVFTRNMKAVFDSTLVTAG
jgi:glycosyltransferase involved in cell wall biosynthesis